MTPLKRVRHYFAVNLRKIKALLYNRMYIGAKSEKSIVDQFSQLYYDSYMFGKTWSKTYWMGQRIKKCPMDLWVYQDIIHELKPDVIIESGTSHGGTSLYLAHMCDLVGHGRVISIDIKDRFKTPEHDRIKYLKGSSTSNEIVNNIKSRIKEGETVMVILDSRHHKYHVDEELKIYSQIVTKGQYLVVEDTNLNGHPVNPKFGPGPMEAVLEFIGKNKDYKIDLEREYHYLTWNPSGYLLRVK